MIRFSSPRVVIADYGMGNLYSVHQACLHVGLEASVELSPAELLAADAIVLPGVGAFGAAMAALEARGLVEPLREAAVSGKPVFGICLGLQLMMSLSHEFGRHEGLGLVEGEVRRFESAERSIRVPQVGWNTIDLPAGAASGAWDETPLAGLEPGAEMYFVHSYYAVPADPRVVLASTTYEGITYCSVLQSGNLFGCQFHPERSGPVGLAIYRNWARQIAARVTSG